MLQCGVCCSVLRRDVGKFVPTGTRILTVGVKPPAVWRSVGDQIRYFDLRCPLQRLERLQPTNHILASITSSIALHRRQKLLKIANISAELELFDPPVSIAEVAEAHHTHTNRAVGGDHRPHVLEDLTHLLVCHVNESACRPGNIHHEGQINGLVQPRSCSCAHHLAVQAGRSRGCFRALTLARRRNEAFLLVEKLLRQTHLSLQLRRRWRRSSIVFWLVARCHRHHD
mmetsp:Transcript_7941/g.18732  ORF Transcript_7941/g.18732 Transcript_7941/m.18732 type:complete len:228 (-) Transcript_7941:21-704(-)